MTPERQDGGVTDLDARLAAAAPTARGLRAPRTPLPERLRALADHAEGLPAEQQGWDLYGEKGALAEVERRTAELLGTQDAVVFPSGIMAQQCALREWSDRMTCRRIALPDLSHLVVHEDDGPRVVHGFEYVWLTTGPCTPTAQDVENLPGELGAVLLELPLRDGGYLLPTWDELVGISEACRERGLPLHLDGARLWESVDHLGHSLAEVVALADSVYVSFYKGLDGLSGAVLAGDEDFCDEARLWRRRLGGTLWTFAPHAVSMLEGLDHVDALPGAHELAVEVARELQGLGIRTFPEVPHTNAFRVFAEGTLEELRERCVEATEGGIALPTRWQPADVPGWCLTEVTVMPDAALSPAEWAQPWRGRSVLGGEAQHLAHAVGHEAAHADEAGGGEQHGQHPHEQVPQRRRADGGRQVDPGDDEQQQDDDRPRGRRQQRLGPRPLGGPQRGVAVGAPGLERLVDLAPLGVGQAPELTHALGREPGVDAEPQGDAQATAHADDCALAEVTARAHLLRHPPAEPGEGHGEEEQGVLAQEVAGRPAVRHGPFLAGSRWAS